MTFAVRSRALAFCCLIAAGAGLAACAAQPPERLPAQGLEEDAARTDQATPGQADEPLVSTIRRTSDVAAITATAEVESIAWGPASPMPAATPASVSRTGDSIVYWVRNHGVCVESLSTSQPPQEPACFAAVAEPPGALVWTNDDSAVAVSENPANIASGQTAYVVRADGTGTVVPEPVDAYTAAPAAYGANQLLFFRVSETTNTLYLLTPGQEGKGLSSAFSPGLVSEWPAVGTGQGLVIQRFTERRTGPTTSGFFAATELWTPNEAPRRILARSDRGPAVALSANGVDPDLLLFAYPAAQGTEEAWLTLVSLSEALAVDLHRSGHAALNATLSPDGQSIAVLWVNERSDRQTISFTPTAAALADEVRWFDVDVELDLRHGDGVYVPTPARRAMTWTTQNQVSIVGPDQILFVEVPEH